MLGDIGYLRRTDQARRDAELKCTLLVRSHLSALIPHPEMEYGESDDENSCKYIALASPCTIILTYSLPQRDTLGFVEGCKVQSNSKSH